MGNEELTTFAFDPSNQNTIYGGGVEGGGKSIDGGQTWTPLSLGTSTLRVNSLIVDPQNSLTVYAGTWGSGVLVSRDGGQSWTAMNLGLPASVTSTSSAVGSMMLDPVNHSTL